MKTSRTKFNAFSLIELLIVMTIIGILVTISMTSYASAQRRSRDTTRKAQVLNISSAIERYRSANGVYAPEYCALRQPTNTCYFPIGTTTTYHGGNGPIESQISDDSGTNPEPAFDIDNSTPARESASGFLLKFMGKPTTLSSTISGAKADAQSFSTWNFVSSYQSSIKNGRIRMTITRDLYWVYAALENKGEKRVPAGTKCWSKPGPVDNAPYYSGVFMAYDDACGANQNDAYKIFSRGSYGEPIPN